MKQFIILFLTTIIAVLTSGCATDNDEIIDNAEQLLANGLIDSAYITINNIYAPEKLDARQQARYALIVGQVHNYRGEALSEDSLLCAALDYYQKLNPTDSAKLIQSTILASKHFWWKGEKQKAYNTLEKHISSGQRTSILLALCELASNDYDYPKFNKYLSLLFNDNSNNDLSFLVRYNLGLTTYYMGNLEAARLVAGEAHFYDLNGDEIEKQTTEIKWDAEAAEKGGFEHFMMKEIHEQPKAVQDTLNSVIKDGAIDLSSVEITEDEIKNFEQVYIVACGSAWHVGMAAQYVLEDMVDIPVRVELASEFRYRKMPLNQKALVIVVSQSGETADTLAALRLAKEKGITTMAIVNVVGSSIAREADKVFYTLAGPEISVATTKAYSAQLVAMYCLAVQFAKVREKITEEQYSYYISELLTLPEKMQKTLEDKERIQWFAAKYANAHDVFFVGRGIDYAVCLEGSLKLKEISYIHSEAYAAGELKHGTISLIEQGTLVIGVLTQSELYEKTISNMLECKSRGAYLMGLTTYGKYEIEDQVNFTVYVPKVDEHFVGSLAVIPLQLLGYYVSVAKGLDVDKPRNLAKSVTVE